MSTCENLEKANDALQVEMKEAAAGNRKGVDDKVNREVAASVQNSPVPSVLGSVFGFHSRAVGVVLFVQVSQC
jgi:hypothetical protein